MTESRDSHGRDADPSRDLQEPEGSGLEARDDDPGREDVESEGGEGARQAATTPPIGTEGKPGQTQVDAPPDDAGSADDQPSRTD
jgi:hypothetical protein